ncbi:hypothetical protein PR048_016523, partial [Dryococelus australis]
MAPTLALQGMMRLSGFWCGMVGHKAPECRHRNSICSSCHKVGYIKRVCRSSSSTQGHYGREIRNSRRVRREHTCVNEDHYGTLFNANLGIDQVQAYKVSMQLNWKSHEFEVDTGAALTIVNHDVIVGGKHGRVYSEVSVEDNFKGKCSVQKLIVADSAGKSLLFRNWFEDLGISVQGSEDDSNILNECEQLFHEEGLPPLKVPHVHIKLKTDAEPKFFEVKSVEIPLCTRVHETLDMLVKEEVLEPTTFSSWETPFVPVLKRYGSI